MTSPPYFSADEHLYARATITDEVYQYATDLAKNAGVTADYKPIKNDVVEFITGGAGAPPDSPGACNGGLAKDFTYDNANHEWAPTNWPVIVSHLSEGDDYQPPPHYMVVEVMGDTVQTTAYELVATSYTQYGNPATWVAKPV